VAACLEECKILVALYIEVRGLVCRYAVINVVISYYSKRPEKWDFRDA
jgi:hypothetical protein